jgi:uncharacterized membrane protein YgcG
VSCPHCGFEIADADAQFGAGEVRLHCLSDHAGVLKRGERERAAALLDRFLVRFPQLFFAVHTSVLSELASLRQFGFWLLNRAAFDDLGADRPNEGGILLVIDPEAKVAGLSFGYLLEPYLDEAETFEALTAAHPFLQQGQYLQAIVEVEKRLSRLLVRRAGQARRDPEKFERKVSAPQLRGGVLRPLRVVGGEPPVAEVEEVGK